MFCPKCGTPQIEGAVTCPQCGAAIPPPAPRTNPLDSERVTRPSEQETKPIPTPYSQTTPTMLAGEPYPQSAPTIAAPPPPGIKPSQPPAPSPYSVPYQQPSQPSSPPPSYAQPYQSPYAQPPANPYGAAFPPQPPAMMGYGQTPYGYGAPNQMTGSASGRAIAGLILGLVSFVTCYFGILFSIPAVILSKMELTAIERGQAPAAGETLAKIGLWAGIIYLGLFGLVVVLGILSSF